VDVGAAGVVRGGSADCEISGSRLRGVRLTGLELVRLRLLDVVLDDCELSGSILTEATFVRVHFNRCRMSGLVAPGLRAQDAQWSECKLDGANFRSSSLERCVWAGDVMVESDFYGATLSSSSFDRCDLTSAEFTKVRCDDVRFHGSTLDAISGADSLGGSTIGSNQVTALALSLLQAVGILVDDD
jgi:uncharacterized protein YjbI with pentapeptide repeats